MAGVYVVTGKLGNGKTLVTVGRMREAMLQGRRVVTNLDLNLRAMFGRKSKNIELIRIPDKPTVDDLRAIGKGYEGPYNEKKFGVLVLDECGTWFNSRNWQDKTRKPVNDWFLHARKLGWEVYLVIQNESILDSQARDTLMEYLATCRRIDNIRLPIIVPVIGAVLTGLLGSLWFGLTAGIVLGFVALVLIYKTPLPRVHVARVTYSDVGMVHDRWVYRGNRLFSCYDTRQAFLADYPHATHCVLPPWYTHGRYSVPMNWRNLMRITKIMWKRFRSPVALATGLLLGVTAAVLAIGSRSVPFSDPTDITTTNLVQAHNEQSVIAVERSPVLDLLETLRIRGSMSINGQYRYELVPRDETGGEDGGERYMTDQDLALAGVTIQPVSDCRLVLHYDGSSVPVGCL